MATENSMPLIKEWDPKLEVLLLGLLVGVIAERCLWPGVVGPGLVLSVAALGLASAWVAWRSGIRWRAEVGLWSALALLAAFGTLLRASLALQVTLLLIILLAGSMLLMRAWGAKPGQSLMVDHLFALILLPLQALAGVALLGHLRLPFGGTLKGGMALLRGVLLAAPLILVFGVLFSSADAAFGRLVNDVGAVFSPDLVRHLFLSLAFGFMAAGLLFALIQQGRTNPLRELELPKVGTTETLVVMGSLVILFVGFVVLQLGYLFGGRETIEMVSGLSLADYARRGFFELLVTAILSLGVLLVGNAISLSRSWFRTLAILLIGCVLVMLVSAVQRLGLYIAEFGLTLDRFNALAIMLWVAFMLLWFAVTTLRELPHKFPAGALFSGIAIAFAMVLLNPSALVARFNIERAEQNFIEVDAYHLVALGADAVPVVMDHLPQFSTGAQCFIAEQFINRWGTEPSGYWRSSEAGWRGWNLAKALALGRVQSSQPELEALLSGCP